MELAPALTEALERLLAAGRVEVRENEAWLAALEGFRYEVRPQGGALLLHLWSAEGNLVRRVLRVIDDQPGRLALEVARHARAKTQRLEFVAAEHARPSGRIARERFRARFCGVAGTAIFRRKGRFAQPTAADLEALPYRATMRAESSRRVRRHGRMLGAAPGEKAATYDALLMIPA